MTKDINLAIVGLGYVGLPLAVEFGNKREVLGYDIDSKRIEELAEGKDRTLEVKKEELDNLNLLSFSCLEDDLSEINFYIVTVPTPIDPNNNPDLIPLIESSKTIGKYLNPGDIVVYESTVYPGATEEVCVPILENESSLKFNKDFFVGYSPERINPGDKQHRLPDIVKIVSGSNKETTRKIDKLYSEIVQAGTYVTSSIRVAEAAKVIENTQRDVNIGLINELSVIFSKLGIDTEDVLKAAETKWNFLPFKPGLVGGHCIGVDPYYLTYKAQSIGHEPEIILAGRRINDAMSQFISSRLYEQLSKKGVNINDSEILIMGFSFKENCPDTRNTKVIDVLNNLKRKGAHVDVYDPWVNKNEVLDTYNIQTLDYPEPNKYDAIIIAVPHNEFVEMGGSEIGQFGKKDSIIFDLKHILDKKYSDLRL
tara:strand:+ start:1076 stop:2347 length:1272 start_codon:yes stop_codon:yes gene_type:complete